MGLAKTLKVNGFKITQNKNHHVTISKNSSTISHIQCNKEMTDEQLMSLLENVLKVREEAFQQYIDYDGSDVFD